MYFNRENSNPAYFGITMFPVTFGDDTIDDICMSSFILIFKPFPISISIM